MTVKTSKIVFHDPNDLFEENMPENSAHSTLIRYLANLLEWLYGDKNWYVVSNLLVQKLIENEQHETEEHYIAPDIALYKDIKLPLPVTIESWKLSEPNRPVFSVVFEVASRATWADDLGDKITDYAFFGAKEYFAYDPNDPPFYGKRTRLRGWKYVNGLAQEIKANAQGWLKSEELNSWLVPDSAFLQLYDLQGNRRLTKDEEIAQQARLEADQKITVLEQLEQAQIKVVAAEQARLDMERKLNEALQKLREAGLA